MKPMPAEREASLDFRPVDEPVFELVFVPELVLVPVDEELEEELPVRVELSETVWPVCLQAST